MEVDESVRERLMAVIAVELAGVGEEGPLPETLLAFEETLRR